jgi:predicted nucleic acid-binding protein
VAAIARRRPSGRWPDFGRDFGFALRDRRALTCCLDVSVMLPILVKEPASAVVDSIMSTAQEKPWVSDFAAAEVVSALSRLVRIGRLQGGRRDSLPFRFRRLARSDDPIMRPMFALRTRMSDALISVYARQMPCVWRLPRGSVRPWSHSIGAWRAPPANSKLPVRAPATS